MGEMILISDAAKEIEVESHVLRYWEDELHLEIKRNELGHRYYTKEDIKQLKQIKELKERGLQLKAIKMILRNGKLDRLEQPKASEANVAAKTKEGIRYEELPAEEEIVRQISEDACEQGKEAENPEGRQEAPVMAIDIVKTAEPAEDVRDDKLKRLQWLFQQMMQEALQENNRHLCQEIRNSVVKELDYQFRAQEEREEERDRLCRERDEAYYRKMDELLRRKSRRFFHTDKKRKGAS